MINIATTMKFGPVDLMTRMSRHNDNIMGQAGIADAIEIMTDKNIGGIAVVDELRHVCGICSEKDFPEQFAGIPADGSTGQHMNKTVGKAPSDPTIESVVSKIEDKAGSLVVMKNGVFCGIVTSRDILQRYPYYSGR